MKSRPISSFDFRSLVVVALLVAGCKSSSAGPAKADAGDDDGASPDLVGAGDDASADALAETDALADDGGPASDGGAGPYGDAGLDGGGAEDRRLCMNACAVAAAVVACPVPIATCMRACDRQFASARCLEELRTVLRCQTAVAPEDYDCVPGGGVTTKAGVCPPDDRLACLRSDAGM